MVSGLLFGQQLTVTGTVVDAATGDPVPFASIQIKGTTTGVSTDDMGKFSIDVDSNGTLIFSSIGYTAVEVPVAGKTQLVVKLETDAVMIEEAIVVGYGSAKKISSVVGSASTVRAKAMENRPVANTADALQGQVAGMQVFTSSGEPGEQASIRIRGVNSINAGTTPLIILDGSPVSSDVFATLSSSDIESVTVLKDASSTAIYGSRAANGVIYITTKKGKKGERARVQIRGQYGISQLTRHKIGLMNTQQWFEFQDIVNNFQGTQMAQSLVDSKKFAETYGINTDWVKYFFKDNAPVYSVEANISGASESTDYYISANGFDQTGTAPNSYMTRYGIRSNLNSKVNDWLKVGINLGLTYQDSRTAGFVGSSSTATNPYNPVWASNTYVPWVSPTLGPQWDEATNSPVLDEEGNWIPVRGERDFFNELGIYNTYYLQEIQPQKNITVYLNGNMYQEITPVKGLTIRAAQAIDAYDFRYSYQALPVGPFTPKTAADGSIQGGGTATEQFQRSYTTTFTNTAEYKFDIQRKHNISVLVGQEAILTTAESFGASASGTTDVRQSEIAFAPNDKQITRGLGETVYNSYFARATYDFADKYYFDASYRIDGSSLFGKNHRYAGFYSVGAMWNIKGEDFMRRVSWITDLRLKASYGTTGNSSISNYLAYGLIGSSGYYNGQLGWGIAQPENGDLTWEVVENLNVGLSGRFFDRFDVSVEAYRKLTKDMLMAIPYSYTTGIASAWGNVGNMTNVGVDFDFNVDIVRTRDIYFGARVNFNYNRNEITELFAGRDEFEVPNTGIKYQVGTSYGELYLPISAGVDPRDGRQMWYDLDGNITKQYSNSLQQFTGLQRYAPWAGGISLNFSWKGLAIGADFSWVAGKYVINNDMFFLRNPVFVFGAEGQNGSADLLNIWTEPGQVTNIPKYGETLQFDTSFVEDASFLRLKNLQISYTFPQEWMRKTRFFESIRVYAIGRNLLTFTKYTGYDPEVDANLQMSNYPNSRQYTVGLEFTF